MFEILFRALCLAIGSILLAFPGVLIVLMCLAKNRMWPEVLPAIILFAAVGVGFVLRGLNFFQLKEEATSNQVTVETGRPSGIKSKVVGGFLVSMGLVFCIVGVTCFFLLRSVAATSPKKIATIEQLSCSQSLRHPNQASCTFKVSLIDELGHKSYSNFLDEVGDVNNYFVGKEVPIVSFENTYRLRNEISGNSFEILMGFLILAIPTAGAGLRILRRAAH